MRHFRNCVQAFRWLLDRTTWVLTDPAGNPVSLTNAEYLLLEALVETPHRVPSREHLLERTHAFEADVFDRSIDVQILRLRRKIEPNPQASRALMAKFIRAFVHVQGGETAIGDRIAAQLDQAPVRAGDLELPGPGRIRHRQVRQWQSLAQGRSRPSPLRVQDLEDLSGRHTEPHIALRQTIEPQVL